MVVNAGQGYDNDSVQDGPFGFKRPEQWAFHQTNGLAANSSKSPVPAHLRSTSTNSTEEPHNRLNSPMKVSQVKFLVRRMKVVVWPSKSHQYGRDL
jgi:hypothetical protein